MRSPGETPAQLDRRRGDRFSMHPYARVARGIAIAAIVLDGLAVTAILMVPTLGPIGFASGGVLAIIGTIVSISGVVVSARCPSPRPVGSAGALLCSLAI